MRKRVWFDVIYIVAAMLILGMTFMAVVYAARDDGVEHIVLPVIETIPYDTETEELRQTEQLPKKAVPVDKGEYKKDIVLKMDPVFAYSREWSDEDRYLLAKIAMAEAEGSTIQSMTLVIMVVLNRVASDRFPDSIHEVIFQYDEETGIYQFSCIGNGRWDRVEPDQNCYEAVSVVQCAEYDYSGGALYFESCSEKDNWHSRNLKFLYQCDELRFYR